ncbi:MAG: fibronectin type III domain-containing protein, partial [Proteobacteria bacterium]|nr:fibronectin type III domain-containing protein [Pseudomonadota bacterium]
MKQLLTILLLVSITPALQAAPGGVSSNLQLWLKADKGISQNNGQTITNWLDQSTNGYTASNTAGDGQTSPTFRNNTSDNINFNPVVEFDGIGNGLDLASDYIYSSNDGLTFFAVVKPDVEPDEQNFIFEFGRNKENSYAFIYANDAFRAWTPLDYGGKYSNIRTHSYGTNSVIYTGKVDFGTEQRIYLNGTSVYNENITLTQLTTNEIKESSNHSSSNAGPVTIGRQAKSIFSNDRLFDGKIAEIILYDVDLPDSNRNKAQSYLAIKYGITLDSTIDYLNSSGVTIYPSTTTSSGYINDIAGIGTDGDLNQPASRSVNSDSVVTITGSGIADGNLLIWGNDDGSLTFSSNEVPGGGNRLVREWIIAETGDVGSVIFSFDLSSVSGADLVDVSRYLLLIDSDGDFSNADYTTGATINGSSIEFSGVDLTDGQYFSLYYHVPLEAPTNLTGSAVSQTQINLSWTDNSTSETGFKIERAGSLIATTAADATSYSDSSLSCGTTYSYSVKATNAVGDSTAAIASATTSACPVTVYHNLTVETTGNGTITTSYGINCGTDCEHDYADQTELALIATPDTNWIFDSWTGDCDDNGEVRINSDKTCTANFVQQHVLTISVEGEGTVNNCGTSCTQTHLADETINLTTSSEGIWALDNWTGDCDINGNVTMDSDKTCTATFVEGYPLTVNFTGKGKIITETQECKTNCEEIIAANSTIKLIAEPEIEWVLDSFSGDCDAEGNVNITGEKSCTANFMEDPNIPNNGDGNGDGLLDAHQPNIISIPDQNSGNYLTIDISKNVTVKEVYTDLAENQGYFEEKYIFPQGLVYFELEGTEADITIYYHSLTELRATPHFQKYGNKTPGDMNTLGWFVLPDVTFDIVEVGGKPVVTANYHLTD